MSKLRFSEAPGTRLATVLVFGVLICIAAVEIAVSNPRLGNSFQVGQKIESSEGSETIEAIDLQGEPGELSNFGEFNRFFDRQERLSKIASAHPEKKKTGVMDLDILFWIQLFVGFGSLMISGWIWSLRPRDAATRFFALSGVSMIVSAVPSAIYTTRELAIPKTIFLWLEYLNAAGAVGFGISIIALFLVYPIQLKNWKKWASAQAGFFALWFVAFWQQWIPGELGISLIIVSAMAVICVIIAIQFFATKKNPQARASLLWLGLSVIVGAGGFVSLNTLPLVLETTPMNQGYAFLFFLIIYLGLAAGLTRFRLFEVGQWAFRFLFYAFGALALVLVDAALIFGLGLSRLPALGIALLALGFVYLPLRDYVWRRFTRAGHLESHELISEALHVAFASSSEERSKRWESLLKKLFDPLELNPSSQVVPAIDIAEDGLVLCLPPVAGTQSLLLRFPWSGRSLFTSDSKAIAVQIVSLIEKAESSRQAYDRGVAEERRRMAQDLHDDVGAKLLTGLYLADEKLRPTLQGVLSEIRTIVSGRAGERISLSQLLADIRFEAAQRLDAAGMKLDWQIQDTQIADRTLVYRQHKALSSGVREIVSNAVKHSKASVLTMDMKFLGDFVQFEVKDNGKGLSQKLTEQTTQGHGLKNLQRRIESIQGTLDIESSSAGTLIRLKFPN